MLLNRSTLSSQPPNQTSLSNDRVSFRFESAFFLHKIIKIEIQFEERDNLQKIINFLNNYGYFLDGFTNVKYFNNKLLFVDAYFSAYKNEK